MSVIEEPESVQVARADHRTRRERHARDCVSLAVVTSTPIAAELIDKAIELTAVARTGR